MSRCLSISWKLPFVCSFSYSGNFFLPFLSVFDRSYGFAFNFHFLFLYPNMHRPKKKKRNFLRFVYFIDADINIYIFMCTLYMSLCIEKMMSTLKFVPNNNSQHYAYGFCATLMFLPYIIAISTKRNTYRHTHRHKQE